MAKRYRLPVYAQSAGGPLGRLDASSDGWFEPRSQEEENFLIASGAYCQDTTRPNVLNLPNSQFGNKALVYFDGRQGDFNIAATRSFELAMEVPWEFDYCQPILAAGLASASPVSPPSCQWWFAQPTSFADADLDGATYAQGYVNNTTPAATFTFTASAADQRKVYIDTVPAAIGAHVARTDGGQYPIVSFRCVLPLSAGNVCIMGNGSEDWATLNSPSIKNGRRRRTRISSGNHVSTAQSTFTANEVTNTYQNPICGAIFYLRGKVVNVLVAGDSIDSTRGTLKTMGWHHTAADIIQDILGIPVCISNLAWSASFSSQARDSIEDFCSTYKQVPDLISVCAASVNDLNTPITTGNINTAQNRLGGILKNISALNGVPRVLRTIMPTNPATKAFGATDYLRRALNEATRNRAGEYVFDAARIPNAPMNALGQEVLAIEDTADGDGIHPNDALNLKMGIAAAPIWLRALMDEQGIR